MFRRLTAGGAGRYVAVGAAGVLAGAGGFAIAASSDGVIRACAAKGTGALRLARHCGPGESRISWNVQGRRGLQGPRGAAGPASGPRDVGTVGVDSNHDPVFRSQGLTGWVSVHKELDANGKGIDGIYCLKPDPSVTMSNAVLIVSMGGGGGTSPGSVEWEGYCASGNPVEFQVYTFDATGTRADRQFTAVVP